MNSDKLAPDSIPGSETTQDGNSSFGSTMNSDKLAPDSIPGSETTQDKISNVPDVRYYGILVPHDGSEKSDIALRHAIYLSKLSGAEIIILNVIEHPKETDSSALIATSYPQQDDSGKPNDKLKVTMYGILRSCHLHSIARFSKTFGRVISIIPGIHYIRIFQSLL